MRSECEERQVLATLVVDGHRVDDGHLAGCGMPCPEGLGDVLARLVQVVSLMVPVPTDPGPLHSIPPALFRAHESFQTGGYQGHMIRLVSGQESGNPP